MVSETENCGLENGNATPAKCHVTKSIFLNVIKEVVTTLLRVRDR